MAQERVPPVEIFTTKDSRDLIRCDGAFIIADAWPGQGREILNALRSLDFPLAQASFLIMAAFVITLNLLVDILYTTLDPRVSFR